MNLEPYALYPHQVAGVEFLAHRGRAILGDDMGLGKTRQGERLRAVPWTGVALDEAHFIKNASQRSSQALKILGVSDDKRAGVSGPRLVFLLTGTPMPNRPRDRPGRRPARHHRREGVGAAGRGGHLQCTCPGFEYRGECKHVRDVRKTALAS